MNERALFFAALDIDDPAARAAFLTEACGGDTDLLQRVKELLQTHERAGSFLERPAVEDTRLDTSPADAPPDGPGSRLGPYRLVRHPIYFGVLLAMAGTAIGFGSFSGLIGVPIASMALWTKASMEEQFMIEQFGADYIRYQHEVKAIIPRVL